MTAYDWMVKKAANLAIAAFRQKCYETHWQCINFACSRWTKVKKEDVYEEVAYRFFRNLRPVEDKA